MSEIFLKAEVHQIVGSAMEVLNELGHGFHEKIYENALVEEFKLRNIQYLQQPRFELRYKSAHVGLYVPDLVCFESIIVDTKTIECITDHEKGKMLNYLKAANLQLGLILNFKKPRLEWQRIIRTHAG